LTSPSQSPAEFGQTINHWFELHRRDLPWRRERSPYRVWIAEVMLQQTIVPVVVKRFDEWMERFPSVEVLAGAAESDVIVAWEGLGYYSRVRNLHRAAQLIVERFGGEFPRNRADLEALPGIGEYTASAILSIAIDLPIPALDVNVRRVMARYFGAGMTPRDVHDFLTEAASATSPSVAGEALMELGQLVCTARNPVCGDCPLFETCKTRGELPEEAEKRSRRASVNRRSEIALVVTYADRILIKPAGTEGLFAGLNLLPTLAFTDLTRADLIIGEFLGYDKPLNVKLLTPVTHHFTTNAVKLHPVSVELEEYVAPPEGYGWFPLETISSKAFPSAHRKILRQIR